MGGRTSSPSISQEMSVGRPSEGIPYIHSDTFQDNNGACCGLIRGSKKKAKWHNNFESNCSELRGEYQWAESLLESSTQFKDTRPQYLRQIDELKYICDKGTFITNEEMKEMTTAHFPTEEDRKLKQQLQRKLTESVIIPSSAKDSRQSLGKQTPKVSMLIRTNTNLGPRQTMLMQQGQIRANVRKTKAALKSFVDENLNTLFTSKQSMQSDPLVTNMFRLFIRFTEIVQRHSNSQGCVLYNIKQAFWKYFHQRYSNIQDINIDHAKDMTCDLKQFIVLFKETIYDYYKVNLMEEMAASCRNVFSEENVINAVTAIIFKFQSLYELVMKVYSAVNLKKEMEMQKIYTRKMDLQPEHLDIKEQYCLNKKTVDWYVDNLSIESGLENVMISTIMEYEPYEECIRSLKLLTTAKTPTGKLKVIMGCAQKISKSIADFYRLNNIATKLTLVDADQVLTIMTYIVMKARIPDISSHLDLIENFSSEDQLMSATGYYYSVVLSSVESLQQEFMRDPSEMTFGF